MKTKISDLIRLALSLAILPVISLADSLPNQIVLNRDGAEMAYIPAGSFQMGDHLDNMSNALPVHTVTLDGFYMDKTEVTVGQFKEFLSDSDYNWGGSWASVATTSPTDDHPMSYVSWNDAVSYANWAGKRLPTEAEWEYAARGGLTSKRYPWGDEIDDTKANYASNVGTTTVAGSYPANGYGLYDMAGNVTEWCNDWYSSDYYTNSPATNPPGPENGGFGRVLRGSGWICNASYLRVAHRGFNDPDSRYGYGGFRCVSGSP
jgi:formylglycine-generating enzyme required for sulfatase activity